MGRGWVGVSEAQCKDLYPRWVTHHLENHYNRIGSPQGVRGTSPHWDPQSGEPMLGRQAPRMPGFEGQWDLLPGDPGGCGK